MSVRCGAEQIADFVALWGMTGTFPEYCEYAEDARGLKSLDLIISTLDVFVEAFCFSFEDIYRKYKIISPLSEEKFIDFLKPRCLLLAKDNKCFNFMLVCAFVYETIHSFSHYNKCFHLVKVASKCLAAILNRFRKTFETDSEWEELISFCIKIHGLVYPPEKINESNGNQLVGFLTDKRDASSPKMTLSEFSVQKYASGDNDYSDTKTSSEKFSKTLNTDSTTEIVGKDLADFCNSESVSSAEGLQRTECSSLKWEKSDENDAREREESAKLSFCVKDQFFPRLSKKFTVVDSKKSNKEGAQNINTNSRFSVLNLGFKKFVNESEVLKSMNNVDNWFDVSAFPLHPEDYILTEEDIDNEFRALGIADSWLPEMTSPLKEAKNEKTLGGSDARKNEKDCVTDVANSSQLDLAKEFNDIVGEKMAISNKEVAERFDKTLDSKKHSILSLKGPETIDLCNSEPASSTGMSHTIPTKNEDFSLNVESEHKKNAVDISNLMNDRGNMTNSLVPDLAHELVKMPVKNTENVKDAEKPEHMIDRRKNLTLNFGKDSSNRNTTKKIAGLYDLESVSSSDKPNILQLEDKECSSTNKYESVKEPFNIRCMTADEVCARIADNPHHLSEVMNLLKKCEDIKPNNFSPDEYNIPINESSEDDGELRTRSGTSENSICSDRNIFESNIKKIILVRNTKMTHSIKRIFREDIGSDDTSSGGEPPHEISDEVANVYGNRIFESEDPQCSLCDAGMINFFDACVNDFITKYPNNNHVTDLLRFDFHDDSE